MRQLVYARTMTVTVPRQKRQTPVAEKDFLTMSVRLPGAVYNQVNALSERERRTLNAQIVYMLERQLERVSRIEGGADAEE